MDFLIFLLEGFAIGVIIGIIFMLIFYLKKNKENKRYRYHSRIEKIKVKSQCSADFGAGIDGTNALQNFKQ